MIQPLFPSGQVVATPGALAALDHNVIEPRQLLDRHFSGDWGDLCEEDKQLNDAALKDGSRILSAYTLPDSTKIWVITEAVGDDGSRSATTLLLPDEY